MEGKARAVPLSIKLIDISFCLGNEKTKSNLAGLCCYAESAFLLFTLEDDTILHMIGIVDLCRFSETHQEIQLELNI